MKSGLIEKRFQEVVHLENACDRLHMFDIVFISRSYIFLKTYYEHDE